MATDDRTQAGERRVSRAGPPPLGIAYWRLWTSSGLSNLADGIFKIALPLVAIRFTDSPTLIAGLTFALTLPWLLFALQAGALADRLDRRRAMLCANTVRAVLLAALTLTVVVGIGSIWALYIIAICVGVAETVYDTSAQSILPQVVSRDLLSRANGHLHAAELAANQFVGPPLGGFLVAAGAATAFAAPAALWVVAVAALLLVRGPFQIERDRHTTIRGDIAEGLRFLLRHRLLRNLAVMVGVFNFASNATWAILVLYAVGPESPLGLSDLAYGALLTTVAAGSVLGSIAAERIEHALGRARALVLTVLGSALLVGAPALTTDPILIGAAFFVGGVTMAVWNVITVSLRQRVIPDRLLGRVNSTYRLVAWGTMPLGAAAGGLLAQFFGLRTVFVVMALLTLSVVAGMVTVTDRNMDAAERDADHS
ncbi:MFS family permease [Streptosporangium lutulentum]|uniref:MFS family permease n=3 Tax=Streptosporangium lutulentum TaxID=1461250 RepID=A0ABT9QPD1_9ACTN|nr:MFS transporter [Streptosporangium lutulentum]MDP9848625.1 MFS family permease [Streptosporangium lutulentum]